LNPKKAEIINLSKLGEVNFQELKNNLRVQLREDHLGEDPPKP